MLDVSDVRGMALALPEAVEQVHHGFPSFRVQGKIFATLPDVTHLRVFVDPDLVEQEVAAAGDWCTALWWGRRLSGIAVSLPGAEPDVVAEWLADAWRHRAPRRLWPSVAD